MTVSSILRVVFIWKRISQIWSYGHVDRNLLTEPLDTRTRQRGGVKPSACVGMSRAEIFGIEHRRGCQQEGFHINAVQPLLDCPAPSSNRLWRFAGIDQFVRPAGRRVATAFGMSTVSILQVFAIFGG